MKNSPFSLDKVSTRYGNYILARIVELPELYCTLREVIHEPTQARIIHIAAQDDENLFCISLRTTPSSSNGVAHILEHVALCGSKKYRIRDPFFEMTRRSLNTYMNALTGADFTCYPAATQVPKDFYNLLDVYLDAVFHPLLRLPSFLQEGHRLEFANIEDPSSPLQFKGVVFNEMKGALSSPDSRINEEMMQALFPDITYGVNSGGDPKEILKLTHKELKQFHKTYYHPSRALFFFYGDLPLQQHLDFLEEKLLEQTKPLKALPPLPKQPRYTQPQHRTGFYPISAEEEIREKEYVALGWLTCSILHQEELLALTVLDIVLMGTDASPLKMALLKSQLCKQAECYLDSEVSEVPLLILCKGCKEGSTEAIEQLIRDVLHKCASEGIAPHLVEGAIHQLEFSRSEIGSGSQPFGLSLFLRAALLQQHGGLPEDGLRIHSLFEKLREKVKEPQYLTGLIQKYLIDNPHFVCLTMHPDSELTAKESTIEAAALKEIRAKISEQEIAKIIKETSALQKAQERTSSVNLKKLPKITLDDVSKESKHFALTKESQGDITLFHHECFTNEIVYADLFLNLPSFYEEELPIVRLFALFFTQMGCAGRNYKEQLDYLLQHTGSLYATLELFVQIEGPNQLKPAWHLRGKALYRKAPELFKLFRELIQGVDFTDIERLRELLMQHFHSLENSLHQSSLRYAANLSMSGLSQAAKISNACYGLDYYWALKTILEEFKVSPEILVSQLQKVQERILRQNEAHLVLSCDASFKENFVKEQCYGLNRLQGADSELWSATYPLTLVTSQGRITSSPVAFTAFSFAAATYCDPRSAALYVGAEIMENKTLHKRIREQGGAYGSGATYSAMSACFYFYTYRDPHVASSLAAFHEAIKKMTQGKFNLSDIEQAQLGVIQSLDSPCSPGSRGLEAYIRWRSGRTQERRQIFRDHLLSLSRGQIMRASQELLLPAFGEGVLISFAGRELLEQENLKLGKEALPLFSF